MNRPFLFTLITVTSLTALAAIVAKNWPAKAPVIVHPVEPVTPVAESHNTLIADPAPGGSLSKTISTPTASSLTAAEQEQLTGLQEILDASDAASAEPELALLRKWAHQDPTGCALWCLENLEGSARLRAVGEAVGVWLGTKPEDAMAWLAQHQGEPGTEQATSMGVMHLAQSEPAQAAAWLQRYPDTGSRENWEIATSQWSATNPAVAKAYLDGNLPEGLRAALLPTLLTSAPPGTDYDSLIINYPPEVQTTSLAQAAESLSHPSPGTALELAAAIPDAAQREAITRRIYTEWQERDPAAAASFAASQEPGSVPTVQ